MIILIMGLPGTGKTTFSRALARRLRAMYISSDEVRTNSNKRGAYSPGDKWNIYEEMQDMLLKALKFSNTVVLDATFYKEEIRRLFTHSGMSLHSEFKFIEIIADPAIVKKRLQFSRKYSEADYQVYLKVKGEFETLDEAHLILDSGKYSLEEMVDRAEKYLSHEQTADRENIEI